MNTHPSMIQHGVNIDIRGGTLESDNLLIYQLLNFMIQVDKILNDIPNTSLMLRTLKIGSIKLGVDFDIFWINCLYQAS